MEMDYNFKPSLAEEAIPGKVTYPKLASFKHNGVRGLVIRGQLRARSLKLIPNKHISKLYSRPYFHGLDGELVCGPWNAEDVFSASMSGTTSYDGEPDVCFYVFDRFDLGVDVPLRLRVASLAVLVEHLNKKYPEVKIVFVKQQVINSDKEMIAMEKEAVALGYEGIVLRDPNVGYKYGRFTQKEGGFLRYCPWLYSEATILKVVEGETNTNKKEVNELGYAHRSSAKVGKVKTGTAGSILVRDIKTKVVFSMQLGTDKECAWFWKHRTEVLGKIMKYKYRRSTKKAPRFPQPCGLRDPIDMSE